MLRLNIMNTLYRVLLTLSLLISAFIFTSCFGDDPDPVPDDNPTKVEPVLPDSYETTVLIYAVASNSLSYDLKNDMEEIYLGAPNIDGLNSKVALLLYSVLPGEETATLSRLMHDDEGYAFKTVKEYDRTVYSTDPGRISKVIEDANEIAPARERGIIFWSHGMGWTPAFSDHVVAGRTSGNRVDMPELTGWYGQDSYNGKSDYCDLTELATAIPDNQLSFIWFDCCFMSGIELIYQMRDKCRTLVAYPTEIMAEGMPYTKTIPLIARSSPDLVGASRALANYFHQKNDPYTIMVADMNSDKIERLAEASKNILADRVSPSVADLVRYSRYSFGPYFDFGQFMLESVNPESENPDELKSEFAQALADITIYKNASDHDFRGVEIPADIYCGISVHFPGHTVRDKEDYYTTLDWYRRVYPQE